jgi:hypothetical protein
MDFSNNTLIKKLYSKLSIIFRNILLEVNNQMLYTSFILALYILTLYFLYTCETPVTFKDDSSYLILH